MDPEQNTYPSAAPTQTDVDVKYGKEQIHERRCSFDIPTLNGASLEMCAERAVAYFKEHVKSQLKAVKSVIIAARGNSFRSVAKYVGELPF
ncbi:2,3-bisphosphoglycerate-dependent phosphoglycerate mutase [Tanacetum coccineum]